MRHQLVILGTVDVHGHGRMLHRARLFAERAFSLTGDSGTMLPLESRDEAIVSMQQLVVHAAADLSR
jgi:hypothetical protein